jgi:glutaredoxin
MKKIKIYTTATCMYCKMAKEFFHEKGVEYEEYNVGTDVEKRKEIGG